MGAPRLHTSFQATDRPLEPDCAPAESRGWQIRARGRESIQLYAVEQPHIEDCLITFRAELKTAQLAGRASLELAGQFRGEGSFSKRGYHAYQGDHDWHLCEVSYRLRPGQRLDQLDLNLFSTGPGTVCVRKAKVLVARMD